MSWAEPEEGEPWISREEIVEREFEAKRREYEELQRLIDERCREAGKRWRASHPWLEPGWCVSVRVRLLCLP